MSEHTPTGLEQDGYNAYGWVDGKWVPVVSTAMGNCWDQDDQRAFCAHIVKAVNYHERLVEALRNALACMESDLEQIEGEWGMGRSIETLERDGELTEEILEARALLAEIGEAE